MLQFQRHIMVIALAALGALATETASANSQTLTLARTNLTNVSDAAGLYQHEAGTLENSSGSSIGTYILVRRVTSGGTDAYNVADQKITLFFAPSSSGVLPETMILEGVYSYNSGAFGGSVAAASGRYHYLIGAEGNGTVVSGQAVTKLVFQYLGTNPF